MKAASNQPLGRTSAVDSEIAHDAEVESSNFGSAALYFRRLDQVLVGATLAEFARRADVPYGAMRNYSDHRSLPGWENAVKIARAAGKSLDWFAKPIDAAFPRVEEPTASYEVSDFVLLPLYDVRASAGGGAWNDDERVSKTLAFRREWIAADLRANPDTLVLVYVDGDSMESTLSSGDVVMVDRSQLALRSDGIYVFSYDGSLLIKRLQRMAGDTVRVISDNPRFTAYDLQVQDFEGEHARAQMIGRVVWSGIRH